SPKSAIMETMRPARPTLLSLPLTLAACGGGGGADGPDALLQRVGVEVAKSKLERNLAPSDANVGALGVGNRAFAFDLYKRVAGSNPGENLVFSPYSISTALAMTYAGARGSTASEMKATLHYDLEQPALHEAFNAADLALSSRGKGQVGADGTPFRLNVDNSIWQQRDYPVVPAFLDTLAVNYEAALYLTDFAKAPENARGAINTWVSDKTEKLIPELLPMGSIDASTVFVLTNTVYFNASWKTKFEKEATRDAPFTRGDGTQITVPTMHAGHRMPYARGTSYQAVALPYASDDLSFIAILPDAGKLSEVEAALSQSWFEELRTKLAPTGVQLAFPKLDYKQHTSLKNELTALGMRAAFEDADFSGMTSGSVVIDDVIHEAVIKVFEGGTIAAAATAVVVRETSAPLFEQTVTLDRPFLYAIVDAPTGQVLFLGRVTDPSAM
ncbi:MAG: serpin family protein, partial [Polyangiales bacterium]